MSLLAVENLCKAFGAVAALTGVDFAVAAGERVALIGPNGAGKTTCFNVIGGQMRPDAGRVTIAGRDVTGRPPHVVWRHGLGRTFQIAAAFRSMTVRENVQTALLARHRRLWSVRARAARLYRGEADALLARVGLAERADGRAAALAYADLKRLELAIALAGAPKLLLLDEPTAGIAAGERQALIALIGDIVRASGLGVLFTEHDMDVVFGHADRVLVLHRGALVAAGSPESVRADPLVREVYLGRGAGAGAPGRC